MPLPLTLAATAISALAWSHYVGPARPEASPPSPTSTALWLSSPPPTSAAACLWTEVAIDPSTSARAPDDLSDRSIGARLGSGQSIALVPDVATPEECRALSESCRAAAAAGRDPITELLDGPGLVRLPTAAAAGRAELSGTPCIDPMPDDADRLCRDVLGRLAAIVDEEMPSVAEELFGGGGGGGADGLAGMLAADRLEYTRREPAVNVYTRGGEFRPHEDAQALTVLVPLSRREEDFTGGGTAFWPDRERSHGRRPSLTLAPPPGTALLFGGTVTHAGLPVESGSRAVLVASFSPPGSRKERERRAEQMQRDVYGDLV